MEASQSLEQVGFRRRHPFFVNFIFFGEECNYQCKCENGNDDDDLYDQRSNNVGYDPESDA